MKHYVGMKEGKWEAFRSSEILPSEATHGHLYLAVMGPFRTRRAALFTAEYGKGNPHIQHVEDAERIAKKYSN